MKIANIKTQSEFINLTSETLASVIGGVSQAEHDAMQAAHGHQRNEAQNGIPAKISPVVPPGRTAFQAYLG